MTDNHNERIKQFVAEAIADAPKPLENPVGYLEWMYSIAHGGTANHEIILPYTMDIEAFLVQMEVSNTPENFVEMTNNLVAAILLQRQLSEQVAGAMSILAMHKIAGQIDDAEELRAAEDKILEWVKGMHGWNVLAVDYMASLPDAIFTPEQIVEMKQEDLECLSLIETMESIRG